MRDHVQVGADIWVPERMAEGGQGGLQLDTPRRVPGRGAVAALHCARTASDCQDYTRNGSWPGPRCILVLLKWKRQEPFNPLLSQGPPTSRLVVNQWGFS